MEILDRDTTSRKKNGRLAWLLAGVIALAFVWRVFSVARSSLPPFAEKDKVLAALPWRIPAAAGGDSEEYNYSWQDNHTILYGIRDEKQKYHLMRQRVRGGQPSAAEPLPYISPLSSLDWLSASPDGKWLLTISNGQNYDYEHSIYALDNGILKQRYITPDYFATWMQDNRSFLCRVVSNGYVAQSWRDQHRTKLRPLSFQLGGFGIVSPLGEYFLDQNQRGSLQSPTLERGSIFTGKSQIHTIPRQGLVLDSTLVSVSPQGNRLLWCQNWRDTPWVAKLWGNVTGRGAVPNNHEAWYITDANGNNPRTWVTVHWQGYHSSYIQRTLVVPQWLPDGKHLSVVYKGALYVVAAP